MKQLFKTLLGTIPLLAVAVTVGAYNNPPAYPTDTTVVPVTTGIADQSKTGGLGVFAFTARDNALFAKTMYVSGIIRGGVRNDANPVCASGCPDSTVKVGDATTPVSLGVQSFIDAENPDPSKGTLTSEALSTARAGGTGNRKLCTISDSVSGATPARVVLCP